VREFLVVVVVVVVVVVSCSCDDAGDGPLYETAQKYLPVRTKVKNKKKRKRKKDIIMKEEDTPFTIGTVIRAIGLKNQSHLNGKLGVVQKSLDAETGRYPTLMAGKGSSLCCFRAVNLEHVVMDKKKVEHEVMMFCSSEES
jgi:hypothetical protein